MRNATFDEWFSSPHLYKTRTPFRMTGDVATFHVRTPSGTSSVTVLIGDVKQDPVTGIWIAAFNDGYSVWGSADIMLQYETTYEQVQAPPELSDPDRGDR